MECQDIYRQLASAYGGHISACSETMGMILQSMVDENEATALLNLPGTPQELARKLGKDASAIDAAMEKAYGLGLVFRKPSGNGASFGYALMGNLIDAVLADRRIDEKGKSFLALWSRFSLELEEHVEKCGRAGYTPQARVLPVEDPLSNESLVLPYERVSSIIRDAKLRIVVDCACRKRRGRCSNPLEMCLMLDDAAEYMLSRNIGRILQEPETLKILDHAEDLGLVHETGRNAHGMQFICNCCTCCCFFLRSHLRFGSHENSIRSRYQPEFDLSKCKGCGICGRRCHFGALEIKNGLPSFHPGRCIGCGLCASKCPAKAISLKTIEPPEFIDNGSSPSLFASQGSSNSLTVT